MKPLWLKYLPDFLRHSLEGRHELQKIVSNSGWLFGDKILRMGVGLFIGVWIARYLGPNEFGLLSYATTFASLFATVASLGLDGIVVRDIVRNPSNKDEILGTAFVLKLAGGVVMLTLAVGSIILVRPGNTLVIWLVGIIASGALFQAFDVIDFWFQSQVSARYTVWARNTVFMLLTFVKVVLILYKAPLIAFALAGLCEIAAGAVAMVFVYTHYGERVRAWRGKYVWVGRLLKDSWPLILSGMMIAVYMKIDQIMLGNILGDNAVGIYSAAVGVSEAWYIIPTTIAASTYPALIKSFQKSEDFFYHKLKMTMGWFFLGALLLSLVVANFSDMIIRILYGSRYLEAANVLTIHIYAGIVVSVGIVFSQKYILDGTTRLSLVGAMTGAITNVVLNLWLIRAYGVVGAAISTVISYIVPTIFIAILFDRRVLFMQIESVYYVLKKENYGKY